MKMKTSKSLLFAALLGFMAAMLTSCRESEDPGPLQEQEKEYAILDFERLEIGDALDVTVEQGTVFSVKAKGDRRNIDDLRVITIGNTLSVNYSNSHRALGRQYTTYITITMPVLNGVSFSGAVNSKISGFESEGDFDVTLFGASKLQLDLTVATIRVGLSGASELNVSGTASKLEAFVSGASEFRGFDLETSTATVDASGASKIKVSATQQLNAKASGASDIRYRGTPALNTSASGASSIGAD